MTNWPVIKLILSHVIVFVLGGVSIIGIMGLGLFSFDEHTGRRPHRPAKEMEQRVASFLTDRLHLTPDQVTKLSPILADTNEQMENLRKATDMQAETVLDGSKTKIEAMLTPDQQADFKKLEDERKKGPRNPLWFLGR